MIQLRDGTWEGRDVSGDSPLAMRMLAQEANVIAVEPIRIYRQFDHPNPPSDPAYSSQWHLHRNQAARSWKFGDGGGVVVAVADSGVSPVSDLACHSYVAPYDFRTNRSVVPPDSNGHGTFVTAVLAECTNNGLAAAGTAPGASIMPLGIIYSDGSSTNEKLYQALEWARTRGADVVNLSLGFPCDGPYSVCKDPVVDSAISALAAKGVVIVAASGNDGGNYLSYPANHPNVIAVGASGYDGAVASYSTKGPGLHLVAPTGDGNDPAGKTGVLQQGTGGIGIASGTSFSAPQVSGAFAILLSAGAPGVGLAISALLQSSQDISPSGYDLSTGYGDLRIRNAVAWGGIGISPPIKDAAFHGVGDFTGDGRTDAITYDGRFGRWWVLTSSGSSFAPDEWTRFSTTSGWSSRLIGDFSGDGRDDLANFHPSNGTWWVSRSTGTSFSTSQWADFSTASGWGPQLVGDFNGDGREDIAQYHSSNGTWWISRSTGTSFSTSQWADFSTASGWTERMVGDFNGDGKDDIAQYHPSNGTWWISRSTGTSFATSRWADFSTASGWQARMVGDFNGDGKDDIAQYHPSNGTWWISRSTGTSFATSLWADFSTASGWGPQLAGDFNGDGKDDIANYHSSNGTWWISRSTGTSFATSLWADYSTSKGWTAQLVGDFNGDGKDDIANHHSVGSWAVSISTGSKFTTPTWFD